MRLHIEKLIFGGLGLARTKEGVVFVEQVIPGETVEAEIIGEKSHTPIASPKKIVEKSPYRRKPPCKYYGICGGCDFQNLDYSMQLELKKEMFVECLRRIGKIRDVPEIEICESPEWEYRIRAQIKVDQEREALGFFRRKSNEVIPVKHCPLLVPELNTILENYKEVFNSLKKSTLQIKCIAGNDSVASSPAIKGITEKHTQITIAGKTFSLTGASFFQGNRFLLETMGLWAKKEVEGDFFIDMFGGLGFFSMMFSDRFSRGLMVESVPEQVRTAKRNFIESGLTHIDTEAVSAEEYLGKMKLPRANLLIVDPPRPGLTRKVREGIRDLQPDSVLYISCNPSTQARDVGFFTKKCGYSIVKAALFDLYPQTHHMETALLLKGSR